jgi:hypothetical protein
MRYEEYCDCRSRPQTTPWEALGVSDEEYESL